MFFQAELRCQAYRTRSCLSGCFGCFFICLIQTAETKYQECLKSLWPSTANCKLCPVNSNFYLLCQQSPHCCFFSVFLVYPVLGDSFTGTGQEGEPEHIPDPLQVQNTKSVCRGLLKNTRRASKAACKQVFCSHQLAWPMLCADAIVLPSWPHLHCLPFMPEILRLLWSKWSRNVSSKLLRQLLNENIPDLCTVLWYSSTPGKAWARLLQGRF